MVLLAGAASGQIGYTLQQCTAKYGPAVDKWSGEWHKFESQPYHLEIHFYKDKADAATYLNWVDRSKAFAKDEIEELLKQSSAGHWEVVDDSPESTMYVVKGFTAIYMKLDHILIVATDGYLERGAAAKAEAALTRPSEAEARLEN
jgi:soluble cytochrome b562